VLSVDNVRSSYGRIEALHGISIEVAAGEIVTLVGANGAGKTTLIRAISGVQPISAGGIRFENRQIERMPAHARVALGIAQVPEGRQLFAPLSVEDNLKLGAWTRRDAGAGSVPVVSEAAPASLRLMRLLRRTGSQFAGKRHELGAELASVYELFPMLAARRHATAGMLSGGQQQMLAIGRALMAKPRLLLLDEPSMGLAPMLVEQILDVVQGLKRAGLTVLLVEQNARAALAIADRGYVVETGRIAVSGSAAQLLADDRVQAAYLGV
jgi:branched-chain amino acid transport system ATP-binding protein